MNRIALLLAATLAVSAVASAHAEDVTVGGIKISSPWSRATPKGASVGAGYLKITNTGTVPDRLVSGATDISKRVEIHEMSLVNDVMRMRPMASGIEIKPGETIEFKPGSYHVMFMGLNKQLMQGEAFKATLQFEKAGKAEVSFAIQGIGAQTGGGHNGMQMKH